MGRDDRRKKLQIKADQKAETDYHFFSQFYRES
jgi:hypothetical protein